LFISGVPINQIQRTDQVGFGGGGGGMAPLQPMNQSAQSTTNQNSSYNPVFSSQPTNLLFGAQPMSSFQQNKNPFS